METKFKYSLIIPVYNTGKELLQLHKEIIHTLSPVLSVEILYIDDFSRDNTWEILKEIKQTDASGQIKIVRLGKNFGQHAATLCGFSKANGEFILTMDDDLQVSPTEFFKLIKECEISQSQVVYGEYNTNQSILRKCLVYCYKKIARLEGRHRGKGSSFRLIRVDLAKKLAEKNRNFIFIDEFFIWYTSKISFVKVNNNPNPLKKSRYRLSGLFSISLKIILYSTDLPLKFVTYLGITLALINSLVGSYFIYKYIIDKIAVPGYTSLIVSILFSTGIILFSLGVITQYLRLILKNINNAPMYHIDEEQC
ncbi:MAG: glycosyltransferase family 2 protein [Bacteroidota bacterium]